MWSPQMATMCQNRFGCLFTITIILLGLVSWIDGQQLTSDVAASPFLFYCKQYDKLPSLQTEWDPSSIKIAQVDLAGNPQSYVPGQVYKGNN